MESDLFVSCLYLLHGSRYIIANISAINFITSPSGADNFNSTPGSNSRVTQKHNNSSHTYILMCSCTSVSTSNSNCVKYLSQYYEFQRCIKMYS